MGSIRRRKRSKRVEAPDHPPLPCVNKRATDGENWEEEAGRRKGKRRRKQQNEEVVQASPCNSMKKKKKGCYGVLSAAERRLDAYRRVGAGNTWKAPPSCHHLLQEEHSFEPWRVLIICILLNVTTGKQVRNVLSDLFHLCPNAQSTTKVPSEAIEKVIRSLGFQKRRAKLIKKFSVEYLGREWTHVTQLHGVGKYAADAYALFCAGKPDQVIPKDHKLVDYWKFVRGEWRSMATYDSTQLRKLYY